MGNSNDKSIKKHRFRDPIYGFIEVNDYELKIIDSPLFQRLRRVHQLALTKYVYPTAEHSRFAHSIGVLQSATDIFNNIVSNSDKKLFSFERAEKKINQDIEKKLQTLRFAALLHDIGHLPFSHAAEHYILEEKADHEQLGQFIIENYKPIKIAIESAGIEPKYVSMLLGDNVIGDYIILKNIISGQLDADRADYLLRDSYCCGVKYGEYDYDRYIKSFIFKQDSDGLTKLCIEEKNIYLVESFLMARYHYNLQVPYHRTRVGYDLALNRYMKFLKENDKLPDFVAYGENNKINDINFEIFEFFDDYQMFEMIKKDSRDGKNYWANILMRQDHLVPVFDHIKKDENDHLMYKEIKFELNKKSKLEDGEDFFFSSKPIEVSKLIQMQNKSLGLIRNGESNVDDILNYSNVLKQLVKPVEVLRIYTTKEKVDLVKTIILKINKKHDKLRKMQ